MEIEIKQQSLPNPDELYDQGKTSLGDLRELKVGAGSSIFYTDKEGSRWGHHTFDSAKAWIKVDGTAQFKTSDGDILLSTSATDGNFINVINTALNTASKTILTDFTFQSTDYAGAFKSGNPTWDENTGLITGGSGVLINARGILGANNGTATFTLDATTGNATFAGTLTAASGTLGTITAGTITGATIQSSTTGYRTVMTNTAGFSLYNGSTYLGKMSCSSGGSVIIDSLDNIYFRDQSTELAHFDSTGLVLPNASGLVISSGGRLRYTGGYLKFDGASGGDVGLKLEGSFVPNADNSYDLGTTSLRWRHGYFEDVTLDDIVINSSGSITVAGNSGDDEEFEVGTSFRKKDGVYQWKARLLTFKKGILTNLGDESGWRDIT
jgi:hypothetical protein